MKILNLIKKLFETGPLTIDVPAEAKVRGTFPIDINNEDMLDEDIYQMEFYGFILDVGWYPAGKKDGHFKCVVVRKGNEWREVGTRLETRDPRKVIKWINRTVAWIKYLVLIRVKL